MIYISFDQVIQHLISKEKPIFLYFAFCLIMKAASHVIFPFPEHYVLFQIVWHGMTAMPKFYIGRDWWDVWHFAVEKFWCSTTSSKFFETSLLWLANNNVTCDNKPISVLSEGSVTHDCWTIWNGTVLPHLSKDGKIWFNDNWRQKYWRRPSFYNNRQKP